MRRRRAAIVLVALALLGTACSGENKKEASGTIEEEQEDVVPVGPQTYTVGMDAPSPEGKNIQVAAFFPPAVSVKPGDIVIFENLSTQAPHTVTFGAASKREETVSPVTNAGLANPVVFGPCYSAVTPPAGSEACLDAPPATPPPYAGTGFWNSGIVTPAGSAAAPGARVALTVASETPEGSYTYRCLLHPDMTGVIDVVLEDDLRKPPAKVVKQGERQRSNSLVAAGRIADPAPPPVVGAAVTSGWGDRTFAVNRFLPEVISIKPGESVMWKAVNPAEPHTVTFEAPFNGAEAPGVFTSGGAPAGARYSGGFAHSGLIGPAPFPTETFSLVFTKSGTYHYVCVLHPGMAGQVQVSD